MNIPESQDYAPGKKATAASNLWTRLHCLLNRNDDLLYCSNERVVITKHLQSPLFEFREYLSLGKLEKAPLVVTYLMNMHLGKAGILALVDHLDLSLWAGSTGNFVGNVLFTHCRARLLGLLRDGELL